MKEKIIVVINILINNKYDILYSKFFLLYYKSVS